MPEIWAIILAAGESVRMKTNKLLLPFQGKTILETVISHVMQSDISNILVVLGAFRDEVIRVISSLPVQHCYNNEYKTGMLSSVQCGFRQMPSTANAAVVFLGDQPMIPGEVTRLLIHAYIRSGKGILIPTYMGKRGHPVLIDTKYAKVIDTLIPEKGLHTLLDKYPEDIGQVEVTVPGILRDIDTMQDYENEIKSK